MNPVVSVAKIAVLCLLLVLTAAPGCDKGASPAQKASASKPVQTPAAGPKAPGGDEPIAGKVLETQNAAGYTYVRLNSAQGELWAAGPNTAVSVGEMVMLGRGQYMTDFKSAALDRTFPKIYFTDSIITGKPGEAKGGPHGQMAHPPRTPAAGVKVEKTAKAGGGHTVAEVYAKKAELAGKEVAVRGTVVKFNGGILGRNWIHIQDGTGQGGTADLTVTTNDEAAVGDVVTIRGTLALDKDFGASYRYAVIVEGAGVTKQ